MSRHISVTLKDFPSAFVASFVVFGSFAEPPTYSIVFNVVIPRTFPLSPNPNKAQNSNINNPHELDEMLRSYCSSTNHFGCLGEKISDGVFFFLPHQLFIACGASISTEFGIPNKCNCVVCSIYARKCDRHSDGRFCVDETEVNGL